MMVDRRMRGVDRREKARPTPDRRRGRPPLTAEERANRQTLHVVLPKPIHDAVCRLARRHGLSDHAAARRLIALALKGKPTEGFLLSK
jgi:hypothetical protein